MREGKFGLKRIPMSVYGEKGEVCTFAPHEGKEPKQKSSFAQCFSHSYPATPHHYPHPHPQVNFRWQRGNKIGEGQYGKVYACVNIDAGELMAMKCIRLSALDHKTIKSVTEEIKIIEGFHHPNLVKYFGVELHSDELLLFMEVWCVGGRLFVVVFVADGINSVGDYNSPPGGCRLYVCMCVPTFFHVSRLDNF